MSDWQNKVAVIIGASRGIAAGLACHCANMGMSAAEYAERVLRAIEADKFRVITHEEFKPMLQLRSQSVLNESNPLTMPEIMQHAAVARA